MKTWEKRNNDMLVNGHENVYVCMYVLVSMYVIYELCTRTHMCYFFEAEDISQMRDQMGIPERAQ